VALLRQIAEKNQLIRMLIKGEADVCVTSILDVDPDAGTVMLDRSINREQNERIVAAGTCPLRNLARQDPHPVGLDKLREANSKAAPRWRPRFPPA
jgi:hypothetical protein